MMSFDFEYFYGNETEQFSFYRVPKMLFKDRFFRNISAEAKILYGLMLDRTGLSIKNSWIDDEGRVYIIYTIADIMEDLNCADQKAGKLLSELDTVKGIGLVERKRQGLGKPNIIYVKNFYSISRFKNSENHDSGKVNITNQDYRNSRSNYNNINKKEFNDTILSYQDEDEEEHEPDMHKWIRERETYKIIIKKNIKYDVMAKRYGETWLDEIVELMVDVVCSKAPYVYINKQKYPHEIVKSRFLKIDCTHIEYIHDALEDNTSNVRNIRAFLITTIYRSFETGDNWYTAKVNSDFANAKRKESDY